MKWKPYSPLLLGLQIQRLMDQWKMVAENPEELVDRLSSHLHKKCQLLQCYYHLPWRSHGMWVEWEISTPWVKQRCPIQWNSTICPRMKTIKCRHTRFWEMNSGSKEVLMMTFSLFCRWISGRNACKWVCPSVTVQEQRQYVCSQVKESKLQEAVAMDTEDTGGICPH